MNLMNIVNVRLMMAMNVVLVSVFAIGCGADSVQNTLNQERDRQRQVAGELAKDYQNIAGSYSTSSLLSTDALERTSYFAMAQINLTYLQKDGTLVPQPSLSGTFRMFNREMVNRLKGKQVSEIKSSCDEIGDVNPQKCGYLFAFSGGVYDVTSKSLALHIQGFGTAGADVSCVRRTEVILDCHWQPASGGSNGFDLTIVKSL